MVAQVSAPVFDSSAQLPHHIAIIMDGNGRWARQKIRPRLFGHRAGVTSVRTIVETARELGVQYLTLYAFSTENWQRPELEVSGLMSLLKKYLIAELENMCKNQIRLCCLGDAERLPTDVRETLLRTIKKTAKNQGLTLNLALNYGSRSEIIGAVQQLAAACVAGKLTPAELTESLLNEALYTEGMPDPDLLIRTGGEQRLSNFLLWQASYAELYFTETMWPDFDAMAFKTALAYFQQRQRRFGRTSAQVESKR